MTGQVSVHCPASHTGLRVHLLTNNISRLRGKLMFCKKIPAHTAAIQTPSLSAACLHRLGRIENEQFSQIFYLKLNVINFNIIVIIRLENCVSLEVSF